MSENVTSLESHKVIKEGSVVTLKSGGPPMVVSQRQADMVLCMWHTESGGMDTAWLKISTVKP